MEKNPNSLVDVPTTSATEPPAEFDIPVELYLLDKSDRVVAARIRQVSHSWFDLNCKESLQTGQRLALFHEGRRIEVEVSFVAQQAPDVFKLAVRVVADKPGEVRPELGLPVDLPATLRVTGDSTPLRVRIVDMSPSGMGIEMPMTLPPGAKVCVNLEQGLAFGEIRFCMRKAPGVYVAGFKLDEYIGQETP